jgi:hypothetical protein
LISYSNSSVDRTGYPLSTREKRRRIRRRMASSSSSSSLASIAEAWARDDPCVATKKIVLEKVKESDEEWLVRGEREENSERS